MIANQNSIQNSMCFMIQGKCEDTLVYSLQMDIDHWHILEKKIRS